MTNFAADDFPPASPHGAIEEIFEDFFWLQGSVTIESVSPDVQINRNMVVLREGGALTVIGAVRLSDEGEAALDALGKVESVIRIGANHGMDDAYYVARYGAAFWCPAGSVRYPEPPPQHYLRVGGPLPFTGGTVFAFENIELPEAAILLRREGGILITSDSLQHWKDWGRCSPAACKFLDQMGFSTTTLVGPVWMRRLTPEGGSMKPDFERLLGLDFKHHIGAHGAPCIGNAHALAKIAVAEAFAG